MLDDKQAAATEHVGIALWRAALAWREEMRAEMVARGFPWHQGAAGEVFAHLGPSGRSQSQLTAAMGISKQAVQQLIDQLEAQGVVRRVTDSKDARAKRIELTELGLKDHREQIEVKALIEARYRKRIGAADFDVMMRALQQLVPPA